MPALLIPVFAYAGLSTLPIGGLLGSLSAAAIAANVTFTALTLTASAALQSAAARKAKKASRRDTSAGQSAQQTLRLAVAPRVRHYGRVRSFGALVFVETRAGVIHQCVVFNAGTIAEYEEFFVGGKPVLLDADGCVTQAPFYVAGFADPNQRSLVRIESRRGYADQPASSILTAAYPGDWTAAHKLNGLAYAVLACRQTAADRYQTVYNSQIPALSAIFKGVAVYDPRDPGQNVTDANTWEWSDNPALCLMDFMRVKMEIGLGAIDIASFAAEATYHDETVPLKGGGTEKRYRLAGSVSYDEQPATVIERMLDTFRGSLYLTGEGRIAVRSARWIEPDPADAIPDDAIISSRIEQREGLLTEYNAVKAVYISPAHGWQEQQAHTIRDEAAVDRLGREMPDTTALPMVHSHTQAQRLAKIELYEDNPEWLGELVCHGAAALKLVGKTVFPLTDADLDLTVTARITGLTIARDLSTATIRWESIAPAAYAWNPETDEGPAPPLPADTSTDPLNPGPPTALSAVVEDAGGGDVRAALRWAAPERAGQIYDLRWRELPGDPWQLVTGITERAYILPAIPDGTETWSWEVRLRTSQGGVSGWAEGTFTNTAFTAATLLAPTALTVTGGQENIAINAVQSASPQAWTVEFSVVPEGSPASWAAPTIRAASPSAAVAATVTQLVGDYDVYARARSPLGSLTSAVVGPVAVTVTESQGGTSGGDSGDGSATGGGTGVSPGGSTTGGNTPGGGDIY